MTSLASAEKRVARAFDASDWYAAEQAVRALYHRQATARARWRGGDVWRPDGRDDAGDDDGRAVRGHGGRDGDPSGEGEGEEGVAPSEGGRGGPRGMWATTVCAGPLVRGLELASPVQSRHGQGRRPLGLAGRDRRSKGVRDEGSGGRAPHRRAPPDAAMANSATAWYPPATTERQRKRLQRLSGGCQGGNGKPRLTQSDETQNRKRREGKTKIAT